MTTHLGIVGFAGYKSDVVLETYRQGGYAIQLVDHIDGDPVATATSFLPGLELGEVAIKDYSENTGMYQILVDAGIIEPAHRHLQSGFAVFPVCWVKGYAPSSHRPFTVGAVLDHKSKQ